MDKLTPEEVKQIAAEIDAHHADYTHPEEWKIYSIAHLYMLPVEAYLVRYEDGYTHVFYRTERGDLEPASTRHYWAPDYERGSKKAEEVSNGN